MAILAILYGMKDGLRARSAKTISLLALLTALGLITFTVEGLLPSLFFPGAKLGLANLFSLFALLAFGLWEALAVTVARVLLGSLFAGNPALLLYSLPAGVGSVLLSRLLLCFFPHVSVLCVSVCSAVAHNLTQLFVYCLLTGTTLVLSYSPFLVSFGVAAGIIVGLALYFTVRALPLAYLEHTLSQKEQNTGRTPPKEVVS